MDKKNMNQFQLFILFRSFYFLIFKLIEYNYVLNIQRILYNTSYLFLVPLLTTALLNAFYE